MHSTQPKSFKNATNMQNLLKDLIKPKLLLLTRFTAKLSLQSFPPSAANTMLGISYTYATLCCSAYGCCAVECSGACCTAQHTAIATLTISTTKEPICISSLSRVQPRWHTNTQTWSNTQSCQRAPKYHALTVDQANC